MRDLFSDDADEIQVEYRVITPNCLRHRKNKILLFCREKGKRE